MNALDLNVLQFLNRAAFKSTSFDTALIVITDSFLFKGVVLIALLWWVWFLPRKYQEDQREIVIATIISGAATLLIGRILAVTLPFRVRPIYNPDVHLKFPVIDPTQYLSSWSSFPSDHAMLWFSIATGIFIVSRRVGVFALVYATLIIGLTRIYFGLHYPTDVLVGALLGIVITMAACFAPLRKRMTMPMLKWSYRHPPSFYACGFLVSYGLATNFNEMREIAKLLFKIST